MNHLNKYLRLFSEQRLIHFEGFEHSSAPEEVEKEIPKEDSNENLGPDIDLPPTEESIQSENADTEQVQDEASSENANGLTERDKRNREIQSKNIDVFSKNIQYTLESKDALQSRLQSWAEASVSKHVDLLDDRLSDVHAQMSRDMEMQSRVLNDCLHRLSNMDRQGISLIDELSQIDPSDDRYRQIKTLVNNNINEANRLSTDTKPMQINLNQTFDEVDIKLDEKKGTYTDTYKDEEFDANDDAIIDQFEDGYHSRKIADDLVSALRNDNVDSVKYDLAIDKAQNVFSQMNPQQRELFEQWINDEISNAGLDQRLKFDGTGNLKIES
ncbi:hypothetical protein HN512_01900 [Candidatus Peregrinibacteria bacterium]|jgi:hypothetical protein|nr:hypothetical protein [Candidatus Peregrinibacteria bacterium]MBT3598567.1 hypothetical protein [Candidatus Peregrinibacteria bacterium]MBT4367404.1 hypothetical protein [Candidatus Peregrinibacteria bacterium]MBT4585284.1 hypothetical protein [Candidatus Peregrinibacteria bacterium]MBT6730562.1 hypothetical protein [Candidatus Peregrinibacteria bacterium]